VARECDSTFNGGLGALRVVELDKSKRFVDCNLKNLTNEPKFHDGKDLSKLRKVLRELILRNF
jgi:hypothetical protein